ncbi:MAG: stage II sporulation protein P [Bacilli bacterium]|uniref:stage II sporulation protein P n=1 Tax=Terrisporobacter sp. TaxID=1965305 RepID=UPI002A82967C|nr:stage II sporulation protein P [Terrisporobacter sp.]MDY3800945.1 stage II sporulation protein P [Bacilli bacterium]MDY4736025.1 stage II sporulation protein P [Terrisporobacter sp.]
MFKKVFSITIIAMLLFNVNTFADTNILSNQQQKVSKVMFERDLKKIIETKKEIIEAAKKEQKKSLGKILIYHTHTLEEYADGTTVIDAGNDLAEKLNNLGFEVDNVVDNFSVDYNNAYASSRNYLSNIDLTQYKLIIDLHRDAAGSKIIRQLEDGDYTVIKFVFSTSNKNYTEQQNLANKISANLQDIYDDDFIYDKGILDFNQDLSNNIVLIENGFNTNTIDEVKNSNTKIANAILQVFEEED